MITMKAHIVLHHYMKFALVFIIEDNFQIQAPGAYDYRRYFCVSDLGGLYKEGLIHGRGYFRNFTVDL